jgi:heme oxygenase (mycobilin-producing)
VFVAVNFITCREDYRGRFEELFGNRAGAIDSMPGFHRMQVLRPSKPGEPYLVISEWEDQESFKAWMKSPAFVEGHRRGFADLEAAKQAGLEAPMSSKFVTYDVITR